MSKVAEKLALQLQKQALTSARRQQRQESRERKERTRALIEAGGLAAKAGLDRLSKEEKLGAFIDVVERLQKDAALRAAWARKGSQVLNPPPAFKRAVEVQFPSRPASTDGLKALGLKYNGTRRCWEGIVDADAAHDLATSLGGRFKLLGGVEVEDEPSEMLSARP